VIPKDTQRLQFRRLTQQDRQFIFRLYSSEAFIRYIGDRGIKNEQDADKFIQDNLLPLYKSPGMGLFAVEHQGEAIGICGLLQRDNLPHPDIGYGYLNRFTGRGFAYEAAQATIDFAEKELELSTLLATTTSDNQASIQLLNKLGFRFVKKQPQTEQQPVTHLYKREK